MQVLERKLEDEKKEVANMSHNTLEVVSDVTQGSISIAQSNGDLKPTENGPVTKAGNASMASKPLALEKRNVANGIVNVC